MGILKPSWIEILAEMEYVPEKKEDRALNGKDCHPTNCPEHSDQQLGAAVTIIIVVMGCCFCALLQNQPAIY